MGPIVIGGQGLIASGPGHSWLVGCNIQQVTLFNAYGVWVVFVTENIKKFRFEMVLELIHSVFSRSKTIALNPSVSQGCSGPLTPPSPTTIARVGHTCSEFLH